MRDCNLPSILGHMMGGRNRFAPSPPRLPPKPVSPPAMIELAPATVARPWHHPGNFAGAALLALLLLCWLALPGRRPDLADWSTWAAAATPLVIAAIAQSQIVLAGGPGGAGGPHGPAGQPPRRRPAGRPSPVLAPC